MPGRLMASLLLLLSGATLVAPRAAARPPTRSNAVRLVDGLVAECRQAAKRWRQACPGRTVHGLCSTRRGRVAPHGVPVSLQPRRAAVAKAALDRYRKVLARWAHGRLLRTVREDEPGREALLVRLRECVAEAYFTVAEAGVEGYLRDEAPQNLDFNPANPTRAKADMKRLSGWLKQKLARGGALIKEYMKVINDARIPVGGKQRGAPGWSLAAILRSGQVFQHFADALRAIPVPAFLSQSPGAVDAYTEEFEKFARPLMEKARVRYQVCVKLAGDLKVPSSNPWAKLCRDALAALPPKTRP